MICLSLERRISPSRRGLSYLEVLIAAGIGLVGMLGAIALFPVATLQMQRGLEADAANAIGEAAIHQAETLDLDNPTRWIFTNPSPPAPFTPVIRGFVQYPNPNNNLQDYVHANDPATNPPQLFTYPNYGNKSWHRSLHPLSSFCIDPRFFSQLDPAQTNNQSYWLYPYVPQLNNNTDDARMWRVSLWNGSRDPNTGLPIPNVTSLAQSRLLFKSSDDLIFNREVKDSFGPLPATQVYMSNAGTNQRRDYLGEYEWMATLVPKFSGSPIPLPLPGNTTSEIVQSGEYVLSIVVFHNRRARLEAILVNQAGENFVEDERIVDVAPNLANVPLQLFYSNGVGGGDVEVVTRAGRPEADLVVRENDWVMLGGMMKQFAPGVQPPEVDIAPIFQWYRVTGTQGDSTVDNSTTPPSYRRVITLQGGDWPALVNPGNPAANPPVPPTPPSYVKFTQMTLVTGVVGVFERTVRLETGDLW